MTNLRSLKRFIPILMLLLMGQSCAQMKNWIPLKNSVKISPPVKKASQQSSQAPSQAADSAKKHMEAGKHQNKQALVKEVVKNIEEIKSAADKAFDKKDFVSAGRSYKILLQKYPHFKDFDKQLSFNSTHLNEKLSHCKKTISNHGFQEYRKGNLGGAIALWQNLLTIDPHNTDIKKSLTTAELQQKNLRKMNKTKGGQTSETY